MILVFLRSIQRGILKKVHCSEEGDSNYFIMVNSNKKWRNGE